MPAEESQSAATSLEKSSATAQIEAPQSANSAVSADDALSLLKNGDLSAADIEALSKNVLVKKSRKVQSAIAGHANTPRRIALRLIREFYTFDLMHFSRIPTVAADLKRIADGLLITRLASVTFGERISLARRASPMVASALLADSEPRVWQTALENPRLAEVAVVNVLLRPNASAALVRAICDHAKWSVRPEIRAALLQNELTPLARALGFARQFSPEQLRDLLHTSRLPEKTKSYLQKEIENQARGKAEL